MNSFPTRTSRFLLPLLLAGSAALSRAEDAADPLPAPPGAAQAGFTSLFDGASFDGWKTSTDEAKLVWGVGQGRIFAKNVRTKGTGAQEPDLWTEKSYRNFELIVDWRLPQRPRTRMMPTFTPDGLFRRDEKGAIVKRELLDGGDSGIYLRGAMRYQVNIWSQPMGSGDLNDLHKDASLPAELRRTLVPMTKADAPLGDWNRFEITLKGDRVTVVLNGRTVIENARLPGIPAEGPVGLQYERGDRVEFANLFLKELP